MPYTVVIALGSNLGNRRRNLLRAVEELRRVISIVRVSSIIETEPVDAPPPKFLNMVVLGHTNLSPEKLFDALQEIVRGGAEAMGARRGTAERDRIPVDDDWDIPKDSRAWRGQIQLGSLHTVQNAKPGLTGGVEITADGAATLPKSGPPLFSLL